VAPLQLCVKHPRVTRFAKRTHSREGAGEENHERSNSETKFMT
jgi:hypothetical protein